LVGLAGFATGAAPLPGRLWLCATSVWLEGPRGSPLRRAIARAFALSARPLGYAPLRALRLGSDDEPAAYVRQFARWALTGRWTATDGTDYLGALGALRVPVLGVVGAADRLCPPADARALLARLPGPALLRVIGRAYGDAL